MHMYYPIGFGLYNEFGGFGYRPLGRADILVSPSENPLLIVCLSILP